jgi:hypothetical protein
VHLGLADVEQESGGLVLDVGEGEGDDLGAAQGEGVAEQDDRGVADPDRGGAVDAADDQADLVNGEWPGQASWCGSVGPHESAAYLADGLGGDGVGGAAESVDVPDHDAGHVQGAGGLAGFGALV